MTDWQPCTRCRAMTRHDAGVCIRDPRHPDTARHVARFGAEHMQAHGWLHRKER